MKDKISRLSHADRWMMDSLDVARPPYSAFQIQADMTNAMDAIEEHRKKGVRLSVTHLLVQASARVLADHEDLHKILVGNARVTPGSVGIGLSVSGEGFVSPILVLENPHSMKLAEISEKVQQRAPQLQEQAKVRHAQLSRWGWLLPFGWMRKLALKALFGRGSFRRRLAGSLQITTVPADWALASAFVSTAVLVAGQIKTRPVARDGQVLAVPTMYLTLCADHRVWDGKSAARFLSALHESLENGRFERQPQEIL